MDSQIAHCPVKLVGLSWPLLWNLAVPNDSSYSFISEWCRLWEQQVTDSFGLPNALWAKHGRLIKNRNNMANYNPVKSIEISKFFREALCITEWRRGSLSSLTVPSSSAVMSSILVYDDILPAPRFLFLFKPFYTISLHFGGAWVTLGKQTCLVIYYSKTSSCDIQVEQSWLKIVSRKQ